jgi:hypothetical protein
LRRLSVLVIAAAAPLLACAPHPQLRTSAIAVHAVSSASPRLRHIHLVVPVIAPFGDGPPLSSRLMDVRATDGDALWLGFVAYYARMDALETRGCYERALARSPDLDARAVTVRITLAASGEALTSEVVRTNAPAEMASCVADTFGKIIWREGDGFRAIEATFRFDKT